MAEEQQPIQVVVAYDFSPSSELALSRAIEVVARAPQHVLHVLTALESHGVGTFENLKYESADHARELILDHVKAAFAGRPTASEVRFYVHARIGRAAAEILRLAKEIGADLIFIGSHGKTGVERLVMGSVSERVVREAGCPVFVTRAKTYATVDLLKVYEFDHVRTPHHAPHTYSYSNAQVTERPPEWR